MADDGGIGRLRKRLAAIPAQVKAATQPALLKQAEAMATTMRALAPEDSGDLKDSITVTPAGQSTPAYSQPGGSLVVPENAVAVTVGDADVRYPHLIEHGTTKMHAQPYFWPSVRLHRKKAQAAIKRAIGKAVRENWGKS
ncbi:MAG TPA: HK97-gp10 family putative phage morphogenesis protein [Kaistia sp.]|nr:HK97-gp10 family putative phage morphogenesis protein [Kaistia sp.]